MSARVEDHTDNVNMWTGQQLLGLFYGGIIFGSYEWVAAHLSITSLPTTLGTALVGLVLYDFLYYWAHRLSHQINFLWAAHVVHHQGEHYTVSLGLRQSWIHVLLVLPLFLPLAVLGFHLGVVVLAITFAALYQLPLHSSRIGRLPRPIEFVFNTPSHHRVHHGSQPEYIDRNHGGVFIIWDRLFGTFQAETVTPVYGTDSPVPPNPVAANVQPWVRLFHAAAQRHGLARIRFLFSSPALLERPVTQPDDARADSRNSWISNAARIVNTLFLLGVMVVLSAGSGVMPVPIVLAGVGLGLTLMVLAGRARPERESRWRLARSPESSSGDWRSGTR